MKLRCLNCDSDGMVLWKGCMCGSCYDPCEVCGGTTKIPFTIHSLLRTTNHQLREWYGDITFAIKWRLFKKPYLKKVESLRKMLTIRELNICEVSLIKRALRVALENVEDPMAGQGDLYAAALEILEKKK